MSETGETLSHVIPSAAPNDAELAAWQALPLPRLQAKLSHHDCSIVSDATMSEILGPAQAAAKGRVG